MGVVTVGEDGEVTGNGDATGGLVSSACPEAVRYGRA